MNAMYAQRFYPENKMIDAQLRGLVDTAWDSYTRLRDADACYLVQPSVPILFFGDLQRYLASPVRVVTVGLNPSRLEFPRSDTQPNPFKRFPEARNLNADRAKAGFHETYVTSLSDYFRIEPYWKWFVSYDHVLRGMHCSYRDNEENTALHTDLYSPLATDPTWSGLSPDQRGQLEQDGVDLWHRLIEYLAPHLIIGSIGRWRYDRIKFTCIADWKELCRIERKKAYVVALRHYRMPDGAEFPLVHGNPLITPFGNVKNDDKRRIGERIKEYMNAK